MRDRVLKWDTQPEVVDSEVTEPRPRRRIVNLNKENDSSSIESLRNRVQALEEMVNRAYQNEIYEVLADSLCRSD